MIRKLNFFVLILAIIILIILGCEKSVTETDNTIPTIVITQPAHGSTLTAPIIIKANATDDDAVAKVSFLVDGEVIGEDDSAPYEQYWNVSYWAGGNAHTVLGKATDASGNIGLSDAISVVVSIEAMTAPILLSPVDGSSITDTNQVTLVWRTFHGSSQYTVVVSSISDFSDTEYSTIVTDTSAITTVLIQGTHYWKVKAQSVLSNCSRYVRYGFILRSTTENGLNNAVSA